MVSAVEKNKAGKEGGGEGLLPGKLWFSVKTLLRWWRLARDLNKQRSWRNAIAKTLLQILRKYLECLNSEHLNLKMFKFYCKYWESPADASVLHLSQGGIVSGRNSQWVWVMPEPDFSGPDTCHWPRLGSYAPESHLLVFGHSVYFLFLCVS